MALNLKIEKLVYGGEGLARVEGAVVLNPVVRPGEDVEAAPAATKKQAQRADLIRVVEPSQDRVTPLCPIFGECGGCHYQHIDYPAQVRFKREILAETLQRGAKLDLKPGSIRTIAGDAWNYRNRVQFHIAGYEIGYREMRSQKLVPAAQCPISSPKINEALAKLNRMVKDRRWPKFVALSKSSPMRTRFNGIFGKQLSRSRNLFLTGWRKKSRVQFRALLEYQVDDDTFTVSGNSFFQVNRSLVNCMADLAIGDASGDSAWDLYAGVGLFTLPLARRFRKVVAVESSRAANDLESNAKRAGVAVETIRQSSETFLMEAHETPDFVLADPPRSGLGPKAVKQLLEIGPKKIVIVACDPATLARDLAELKTGYEISRSDDGGSIPADFSHRDGHRISAPNWRAELIR